MSTAKCNYYNSGQIFMNKSQTTTSGQLFNFESADYLEPRFPNLVGKQGLNILRGLCSVALFIMWNMINVLISPGAQFIFMTMWGNSAALITSVLSLYISIKGSENVSSKIKRWNYLLLEFVFSMEMVITIVYWTSIHPLLNQILKEAKLDGSVYQIPLQISIHSVPLFAVCCNVVLSKIRFNPNNWTFTFIASTIFMFVNFGGSKLAGMPFYPFLPWDGSFRTYFNAVFLVLMATVLNYLCSKFIVNRLPLTPVQLTKLAKQE
ncbi:hypothetical protein FGO68_gene3412 [Halteria grandinella]|uniref:Uncharacterized protein n=1 Tax=Halteria grandinella TaxID=5974 RepID=A0A8J8NKE9_HALGN|nr:hypothetical protein FGO68_gene3412 [Halteria grandinella]